MDYYKGQFFFLFQRAREHSCTCFTALPCVTLSSHWAYLTDNLHAILLSSNLCANVSDTFTNSWHALSRRRPLFCPSLISNHATKCNYIFMLMEVLKIPENLANILGLCDSYFRTCFTLHPINRLLYCCLQKDNIRYLCVPDPSEQSQLKGPGTATQPPGCLLIRLWQSIIIFLQQLLHFLNLAQKNKDLEEESAKWQFNTKCKPGFEREQHTGEGRGERGLGTVGSSELPIHES